MVLRCHKKSMPLRFIQACNYGFDNNPLLKFKLYILHSSIFVTNACSQLVEYCLPHHMHMHISNQSIFNDIMHMHHDHNSNK